MTEINERLGVPRSMKYIAKVAGWDTATTRRKLLRLHQETGETLLSKRCGQYEVTIGQLRRYWPEFGKKMPTEGDVIAMEDAIRGLQLAIQELRNEQRKQAAAISVLKGFAGV